MDREAWSAAVLLLLLLLLLSRFSRVQLCVTPQMATHQAPLSLGFSRQEHWVGCHFLLQCMKVQCESEVAQSCPTLRNPMDCSLPGSSAHGIFQARVLEWVATAFSGAAVHGVPKRWTRLSDWTELNWILLGIMISGIILKNPCTSSEKFQDRLASIIPFSEMLKLSACLRS